MALSEKRYKARPVRLHTYPTSVLDRLPRFVESARSILRSGDEHGWFIWFYRGANPVHHRALAARDAADKRVLSQELAELVYLNDIDGVMEVGECWVGEPLLDEEGAPIPAAEQPDRREAVTIHVATAAGVEKSVVIPFRRRRFGRPVIEDPVYDVALVNNFIAPIKAAWRRQRETP